MNGSHLAGTGGGGILAVVLAALGNRIGLHLAPAEAAGIALGLPVVGLGFGHAIGSAWRGPGVFPALRRGLFGSTTAPVPLPPVQPAAVAPEPPPTS